jgi:hypothetical protein
LTPGRRSSPPPIEKPPMARKPGRPPTPEESLAVAKRPFIDTLIGTALAAHNGLEQSAPVRDLQVEDAFFRAAVALETFLSEWLVRCLSFDASVFRATYEGRAANWAKRELETFEPSDRLWKARGAAIAVKVELPISKKHDLDETRSLLGAEDENVSIPGTKALIEDAKAYVVEPYARRPRSLSQESKAILDATVAIRNVIAHRSTRATERMNQKLGSKKLPAPLQRGSRKVTAPKVGYHLQATSHGRPRFEWYFEGLAEIGHALAPTRGRPKRFCPWHQP